MTITILPRIRVSRKRAHLLHRDPDDRAERSEIRRLAAIAAELSSEFGRSGDKHTWNRGRLLAQEAAMLVVKYGGGSAEARQ